MPCHLTRALLRRPAPAVVAGLSAAGLSPDFDSVVAEHDAYAAALAAAGVKTDVLPALEAFPDCLFVEDPALVFPDCAVVLRPGATSRVGEAAAIRPALVERFERVVDLPEGTAEGGDVLRLPDVCLIGLSGRTNRAGAEALCDALRALNRAGKIVDTPEGVLHFKSECSLLDAETVLATPRLAGTGVFAKHRVIETAEGEESAANALRVNDTLLVAKGFPRTAEVLARSYSVVEVDVTEVSKIDAGLSCMSLLW